MKPFDLEDALRGEKVLTRDGQEVTQFHLFDVENDNYPLCGVFSGKLKRWTKNGVYYTDTSNSRFDLFMAEEEKQPVVRYKWAFYAGGQWIEPGPFLTEEQSKKYFKGYEAFKRLDYTRTEFEE